MCAKIINFDDEYIKKIGIFITDNVDYLIEDKIYTKLCAAKDRIEEIILGLNNKEFHIKSHEPAFEYYEFLGQAFVLVDAIHILAKLLSDSNCDCLSKLEKKTNTKTIAAKDLTGKGDDFKFFKYLRSLCSEHPVETDQHPDYSNVEEWCPFANWGGADEVVAMIYDKNRNTRLLRISISSISNYVVDYYNQLSWIINCLENHVEQRKNGLRSKQLMGPNNFSDYADYLKYLKRENRKRMDCNSDCLNLALLFISSVVSSSNKSVFDKFIQYIKIAMVFEHNRIQKISMVDYDCRGVDEGDTSLINKLFYPSVKSDCKSMQNIRGKMEKLMSDEYSYCGENPSRSDIQYAKSLRIMDVGILRSTIFDEFEYFSKYVTISEEMSDLELYLMIQIAYLMEAIEKDPGTYKELVKKETQL